jgi:hypothetical protein
MLFAWDRTASLRETAVPYCSTSGRSLTKRLRADLGRREHETDGDQHAPGGAPRSWRALAAVAAGLRS